MQNINDKSVTVRLLLGEVWVRRYGHKWNSPLELAEVQEECEILEHKVERLFYSKPTTVFQYLAQVFVEQAVMLGKA